MKVTVCQLRNRPSQLAEDWQALLEHCSAAKPDLVLLPEMPFSPWLAASDQASARAWQEAALAHQAWQDKLPALGAAAVLATRPVEREGKRFNEGFVWQPGEGARAAHRKHYLPDEPGFWEATWYQAAPPEFLPCRAAGLLAGFLICTELWFSEHARAYGRAGAELLVCPRATPAGSTDKWLAGGRAAAVVSGAFCLSSNLAGEDGHGGRMGGLGWVVHPEEGDVLAVTSEAQPFATVEIDPDQARAAKATYPRYVAE